MSNSENMEMDRREELTEQLAAVTAERDQLNDALNVSHGETDEQSLRADKAEAERDTIRKSTACNCVEICYKIWIETDSESEAECAVAGCMETIKEEFNAS